MFISATGLACPVGLNAPAACAAMQAGIGIANQLPYACSTGELIMGSAIEQLPHDTEHQERLLAMLSRAIMDCLSRSPHLIPERTPLLVVIAHSDDPSWCPEIAGPRLFASLQARLGVSFDPSYSQIFPQGVVGTTSALNIANQRMQQSGIDDVLVCGVDSLIDETILAIYDQQSRLKTPKRPDGLIPGEGAACVRMTRRQGTPHSPQLLGSGGLATEVATILNDEPFRCDGLTLAARTALQGARLQMQDIDFRISDATGESYGLREQSLLVSRLIREEKEELPLWHPAEYVGCTGAAAALLQMVVLEDSYRAGYAPGQRAMICCGNASGERSVTIFQAQIAGAAQ